MTSRPCSAPVMPPETGASISVTSRLARTAESSRVPVGSDEVMSMTTPPGASDASNAPVSSCRKTWRTIGPVGSMVMTTSELRPRSPRDVAGRARCDCVNCSTLRRSASCTVRERPARARLAAMRAPMAPIPINPILVSPAIDRPFAKRRANCSASTLRAACPIRLIVRRSHHVCPIAM